MRFVVVREALPACIHVTVIQSVVDIAVQTTQQNVQHSGDVSFVCVSAFSDTTICTTHITVRNGRSRRGPDWWLPTYSALTERVIPLPIPVPMTLRVFCELPRTDYVFPAIRHPSHANIRGNMTLHTVECTVSTLELDDQSSRSLVSRLFYRRFPHF